MKPAARRRLTLVLAGLAMLVPAASCRRGEQPGPAAPPLPSIVTKTGAEMVLIPAGRFAMGSTDGRPDEAPVHEVHLDAFLMDRTEVTQEQYGKLVVANPSHFKGPDRPAEQVSWAEAAMYCNLRSRDEGLEPCYDEQTARCNFQANGYRLPSEAEWEYACRAGSEGPWCFGAEVRLLKQFAWYGDNASKKTQPVAQKKPNAWGLHDMHGNVAEWCNDVYAADCYQKSPGVNPQGPEDGEKYVLRGGAWNSRPEGCRSAARVGEDPGFQDACFARDAIGFRCVRRAPASMTPNASPGTPAGAEAGPPTTIPQSRGAGPLAPGHLAAAVAGQVTAAPALSAERERPMKTGFVYGGVYLRHETGEGHPERPQRVTAIVRRLEEKGLLGQLARIEPAPAERRWLTAIHSSQYVDHVRHACEAGVPYLDSPDTPISEQSYQAALAAAGGMLAAVDAVVEGRLRNVFCAVRPPGHHATHNRAMGFCLLNNVAIAARYAQQKHKLAKVLIADWDVHHGNGTQAAFYDDPSVMYFSVHQSPFYPGTGEAEEKGAGKAVGTKINVPLPAGSGDAEYLRAFRETLQPAALAFRPDLVLVSAGFDAHESDLLGGMKVTAEGFAQLTRIVKQIAEQCCRGRLVATLEGGYNLDGLAECVEAHVRVLME